MKIFKLKKSDYSDLFTLYERVECVHKNRYAFPYHTFVSPNTYKKIRQATTKEFKKQHPYLPTKSKTLAYSVEMHLLNLGPCELKGLGDNIILVDDRAVEECKKDLDNANNGTNI